jgi:hypothetical protein
MADLEGVARVNISVPRGLKKRMDAAKKPVNWSAVAAEAFEDMLLKLESTKEVVTMDDVIGRMIAAEALDSKQDYLEGEQAGEGWAKKRARPKQLRGLAKLAGKAPDALTWQLGVFRDEMHRGLAFELYRVLHPTEEVRGSDVVRFWEQALGRGGAERIEGYDFAYGFVQGALDVWERVEAHIG